MPTIRIADEILANFDLSISDAASKCMKWHRIIGLVHAIRNIISNDDVVILGERVSQCVGKRVVSKPV